MIDSGDDSADEVVSKSEYKVTFVLLYAVKFKSPLKVSNIYIYRDQKRTAIFFVMGKTKYITVNVLMLFEYNSGDFTISGMNIMGVL